MAANPPVVDAYESEGAMLRHVTAEARRYGWLIYHASRSDYGRTIGRGFPDLIMVRGPHCMALELKHTRGVVTPEQQTWVAALYAAGIDARVVWPDDMPDILRALATAGV